MIHRVILLVLLSSSFSSFSSSSRKYHKYSHLYNSHKTPENHLILSFNGVSYYGFNQYLEIGTNISYDIQKWYNSTIKHKMFDLENTLTTYNGSWLKGMFPTITDEMSFWIFHNSIINSHQIYNFNINYGLGYAKIKYNIGNILGNISVFDIIVGSDLFISQRSTLTIGASFPLFSSHLREEDSDIIKINSNFLLFKGVTEYFIPYSYFF